MGFTLKSSYALRALYKMAKSAREGKEKLSLVEIVQGNEIPRDFLEKIFGELRQAGIIKAVRGRYGGYCLARPANEILLRDVILKLDRPMNSYACLQQNGKCLEDPDCTVKYVWFKLYNAMMRELGSMTLENLLIYGDKISETPPGSYKIFENPE
ncbi:Rrf2 family transcriptional regulator [Mesotoga sp. Brook.08.YT.4.2.5.1]|jgi:Rrf2 family protein|uniref:RrF2 family transcriptional regulator n=1 Tax=unclassified Mesotoga TaxID=1184398 RepID=UPI000C19E39A|nr:MULTISPECIES: Rrf2 family transcriptional regulator [unclassified Mesotoga]RAM59124.1 Rrf2 family transcriptional regulator [Mesotoga sp. SC_4PWL113PWK15]PNE19805.1 Rrf2 family transcriptional regulator [Mesotoga sp. Brook.08.YT.4.2.5.1]PVD15985.1 Rrf2 family transcriptional regulator [Mesotoga sp. Brook.08.105.5.1]RAO97520.1 Rrf2 family transcriptional regulator [Mesotoga sp. Brook.08.YT.4.2.5.4.]RDI94309.1 Rrf2 family transcriptional regulator [Mesotoga sp. Brook.08.YT.4.2.5.2.]